MCGIAGFAGPDAARRVDDVRAALERMGHRGPDGMGWHEDDGIVIGMCRLAIVGLVGGDQPVFDEEGTRVVVCNGEIYNHVELRAELGPRHTISSTSDAAVIPHLHEDDPDGFLRRLRGMFAFALWDGRARRLVLARDRLGKKPLFWSATPGGGVAFASELPALREIVGRHHAIDEVAVHHYLALGMIPGPRTIYRDVSALPVASRLDVDRDGGAPEVRPWAGPPEPPEPVSATGESLLDAIDDRLTDAVRLRLRSDVPMGVMLSGGIDSGLVARARRPCRSAATSTHSSCAPWTLGTTSPNWPGGRRRSGGSADRRGRHSATSMRRRCARPSAPTASRSATPVRFRRGCSRGRSRRIASACSSATAATRSSPATAGTRSSGGWRAFLGSTCAASSRAATIGRSVLGFARRAARISGVRGPDAYQLLTTDLVTPAVMLSAFPQLASREAESELRDLLPVDPFAGGGRGAHACRPRPAARLGPAAEDGHRDDVAWRRGSLTVPRRRTGGVRLVDPGVACRRPVDHQAAAACAGPPAPAAEVARAPKRGFEVPLDRWLAGPLRPLVEDLLLAPDARIAQFAEVGAIRRLVTGGDGRVGDRPRLVWALLVLELFLRESSEPSARLADRSLHGSVREVQTGQAAERLLRVSSRGQSALHGRLHERSSRKLSHSAPQSTPSGSTASPDDAPGRSTRSRLDPPHQPTRHTLGAESNYLEIGVRARWDVRERAGGQTHRCRALPCLRPGAPAQRDEDVHHDLRRVLRDIGPGNEVRCRLRRWAPSLRAGVSRHDQRVRHLSPRGLLLLDDVVPSDELSAHRDLDEAMRLQRVAGVERPLWHGDVYRTVCVLLEHHPDLCVRTIVGSGNPQALIWNARPDVAPTAVTAEQLSPYGTVSYEALFADGVPAKFAPGEEEAVLAEGLASVVGR